MDDHLRFLAVGVHLHEEDTSGVEDVESWPIGPLQLTVLRYDSRSGVADQKLIARAAAARRALLDRQTFIAIRYGFTVRTREDAAMKCSPMVEGWRRQLERFRGSVEITLKAGSTEHPRPQSSEAASGREYLLALHRQRTSVGLPDEFRKAAETMIGSVSNEWKWQSRDDGAYELCAVVARGRLEEISSIGASLKQSFVEVPFLLSGPWPLETFASE